MWFGEIWGHHSKHRVSCLTETCCYCWKQTQLKLPTIFIIVYLCVQGIYEIQFSSNEKLIHSRYKKYVCFIYYYYFIKKPPKLSFVLNILHVHYSTVKCSIYITVKIYYWWLYKWISQHFSMKINESVLSRIFFFIL